MEEYTEHAIAFGLGLGAMVIITILSTLYGWKRLQPFYVEPRFSIFSPLVKVTWESRRFGDWIAFLRFVVLCGLCTAGYYTAELELAIAFGVGATMGMLLPQLGNFVIGIIDRYEIEPRPRKARAKPMTTKGRNQQSTPKPQSAPEPTTTKPRRQAAKPKESTGGGWRSE